MEEQFDTTLPTEDVSSSKFDGSLQIISDNSLILVQRVAAFLVSLFAVLGGFTNTINIVVFWMLGFSYVSNISLFALSVSDLLPGHQLMDNSRHQRREVLLHTVPSEGRKRFVGRK
ncbi:hypothetical protein RRG08_060506 [Elysia crispata]|uniref:G-protein coupled receptors family 1 profile domain-containing protein n=1 Tax=Elysia crispata TaxID=231223 RepID=A0AAE1E7T5_9GAST|nr:hypothetical protein RRG08_060506 [Elysia crispata]